MTIANGPDDKLKMDDCSFGVTGMGSLCNGSSLYPKGLSLLINNKILLTKWPAVFGFLKSKLHNFAHIEHMMEVIIMVETTYKPSQKAWKKFVILFHLNQNCNFNILK